MTLLGKNQACAGCNVVTWVVTILLFLGSLASLIGVYKTHFPPSGMTFTSPQGAMYLIAFVLSLTLWAKHMCKCCGCCSSCCK